MARPDRTEDRRADPSQIFDLHVSFHQTIVDARAGPRLRAPQRSVKPQTQRYGRLSASVIRTARACQSASTKASSQASRKVMPALPHAP
jgi:hypothetical protein